MRDGAQGRACEACGAEWELCECICAECHRAPCECEQEPEALPTAEEHAAGIALCDAVLAGRPFHVGEGDAVRILAVAAAEARRRGQ